MNLDPESAKRTEEIRHEIDRTRERMDQTIDALADRFKGRHLVDEAIGLLRSKSNSSPETVSKIKEQVVKSASSVANSIASTVKDNPIPIALVGAGVAWMIYSGMRARKNDDSEFEQYRVRPSYLREDDYSEPGFESSGGGYSSAGYSAEEYQEELSTEFAGEPGGHEESGSGLVEKAGEGVHGLKDKAGQALHELRERAMRLKDKLSDGTEGLRNRASDLQERTQRAYQAGRERVVETARAHPLEIGLGLLVAGVAVGLALPTPRKVNQVVGGRADRLRDRAKEMSRELARRGAEVARAAAQAARDEAKSSSGAAGSSSGVNSSSANSSIRQEGMMADNASGVEKSQTAASI